MTQETKILGGIIGASIVVLFSAIFFLSNSSKVANTALLSEIDKKLLVRDDSNKISTASAKVTLVEFGDYQCPACKAAEPIIKQLLNDEKGKINFVFRNLAFLGQESTWAAEAAECAVSEGKFWQYHDYLYEHQGVENSGAFSKEKLKDFAVALNLNTEQFKFCLDTDKYSQKVANDVADARDLGVNSTPTFFLNGEKLVGVSSYADLKSKVESKINSK